jgi:hypothetical protein
MNESGMVAMLWKKLDRLERETVELCIDPEHPELSPAEEAELTEAFVRVRAALVTAAVAAGRARLTVCRLARKRGVDRGR